MNIMPIVKQIKSNYAEMHKTGAAPLLVNTCCATGFLETETSKELASQFPVIIEIDKNFSLPTLYRIGDYSVAQTEFGTILNFYTQLQPNDNFEYSALKLCLKKLSMEAIRSGGYIELVFPISKLNGASWDIIKKILNFQEQLLITVVEYDKGEVSVDKTETESAS
jgi:hypothetical protein